MYPRTSYQASTSKFEDLEEDVSDSVSTSEMTGLRQFSSAGNKISRRGARYPMIHYFIAGCCFLTTLGLLIFSTTNARSSAVSTTSLVLETNVLGLNEDILRSPCGSSPAEAKALGCTFDIISFCWLPTRCYDAELSHTFDELVQWEWYIDHNKTQPVSKSEALTGELDGLYVSWEYHVQHCVYMWEKMHRALMGEGKRAVDGYIGVYAHTQHCGKMLLTRGDGFELSDFNTRIRVKYPDCGIE
ncbi:uncharacterized protein PAC_18186 [Phialocephala subalpina]|uniref:Uncharacterized protein n=1 Tax=Phialocephala subalpina TaxID=576137 RepID=A0A1L7XTJ3_9HELO|nr:uncharacterized protein PAC_18186 [Phialocephala subalpina]